MVDIRQANVLIIATAGFEETQLTVPQSKLNQAGAIVHIAAPKSRSGSESIRGRDKADRRKNVGYDQNIETINQNGYDALILPGGQINRDKLRLKPSALDVVWSFVESGRDVAAICHAPWLLIEVGAAKGRRMTSFASISTDVVNAGAERQDPPVVADQGIVTSRNPGELDAFSAKIIEEIEQWNHGVRRLAA